MRGATPAVIAWAALLACSEPRREPARVEAPIVAPRDAAATLDTTIGDASAGAPVAAAPRSLDEALAALRGRGLGSSADVIAQRVAQRSAKMKLTDDQALGAARALLAVAERDSMRALHAVMPRSTVELARAVAERGVPLAEADAIARYLVRVVDALAFERLRTFDDNHSHVTGREWHEIDYSGEGMTWQQQKADWSKQGVESFKTARSIHAYFVGAERLPHWKRVYRPRGTMAAVAAPASVDAR